MSSRALRRLQKKQIEIEPVISDEESDEYEPPAKAQNLFDLLNEGDEDQEEEEEEEEEEEKEQVEVKEVKNEKTIEEEKKEEIKILALKDNKNNNNKSNKSSKKNKNKKKQQQKKKNIDDMSMQELDKVLDEIQQKDKKKTSQVISDNKDNNIDPSNPEFILNNTTRQLLNVNYRYLDAEAEMKRMFGSRIVNREARPSGKLLKKTKLATPKADWPMYQKQGLSMESLDTVHNTTLYSFKHQGAYQDTQAMYLQAISNHDPNSLVILHHQHPYHVDILLQLSDIATQQGDRSAAGDFIDRALYSSERAFHPHFTFGTGNVRLPYKRSENRSFFVAIVRNIQFLASRGCWRTAFEFNKLLFSLSPFEDPTGALLSLDYFALYAKEYQYVVDFGKNWKTDNQNYPTYASSLPNFAFSAAYAKFKQYQLEQSDNNKKNNDGDDDTTMNDEDKDGSIMLKKAISLFPGLIPRLLQALDVSDSIVDSHLDYFTKAKINDYLSLLFALYVDRTYELWKEPEVLDWLKKNVHEVLTNSAYHGKAISKLSRQQKTHTIPLNVCRHILFLNKRELLSMLPSTLSLNSFHASDPLPPEDSEIGYDIEEHIQSTRQGFNQQQQGGLFAMLQNLLAGGPMNANMRARLNQVMGEMAPNMGAIPGTFPGLSEDDEIVDAELFDADDDDEIDEETLQQLIDSTLPNDSETNTESLNNENQESTAQHNHQRNEDSQRSNHR